MCVLAMWVGLDPGTPLVAAANRDEFLSRPSAAPAEIEPGIVAGRDLVKGGTWLGVRRGGPFVAVLNRRTPAWTPESSSRGVLALDALRCASLEDIADLVTERVAAAAHGGFNLVAVMGREGISTHYDGAVRVQAFGRGPHVISSDVDLDAPEMPEKAAFDQFVAKHDGPPDDEALRGFLAEHDGARPICKHGVAFGTVSSSVVRVFVDGSFRMEHAPGAPCVTPFASVET